MRGCARCGPGQLERVAGDKTLAGGVVGEQARIVEGDREGPLPARQQRQVRVVVLHGEHKQQVVADVSGGQEVFLDVLVSGGPHRVS